MKNKVVGYIILRRGIFPFVRDRKIIVYLTEKEAKDFCSRPKDVTKSVTQTDLDQLNRRYT